MTFMLCMGENPIRPNAPVLKVLPTPDHPISFLTPSLPTRDA